MRGKIRALLGIFALALTLAPPVAAESTAKEFIDHCLANETRRGRAPSAGPKRESYILDIGWCIGFIQGTAMVMQKHRQIELDKQGLSLNERKSARTYCFDHYPEDETTWGHAGSLVMEMLEERKEWHDMDADVAILKALEEQYPCKDDER